ncbi:MAG TPA: single-stranded DNA-binding protein [Ignavibacteria bacterium]|nr:single-stranded DNA-binding protein [Ignavibacteria bacterium]
MAKGLNKVMLIGHLGKDPEMSYTPKGIALCRFSLATSDSYKGEDGNWIDRTEWHNITVWNKLAEICSQYLKKGSKIYMEGKIQTDSYDKDGKKTYFTKIIMSEMVMLDKKEGGAVASESTNGTAVPEQVSDKSTEEDLPF